MQTENDYDKEVRNGDLGFITGIDPDVDEIKIDFDGREVSYQFGELDRVVFAYATTIHKSQGSECPVVIIPVTTQHYPMLQRNLLYTGITRGKRLVISLGQESDHDRGQECIGTTSLVEVAGMVARTRRLVFRQGSFTRR
jgi:exodeoxyribonuclease V alpha subunit